MKKLIAELPMLTAPKEKEELIIYLAAAKEAISAVLMTERGGQAIASVLCESFPTRAGDQLHPHGKISISLAQRKQTAEKLQGYDIQYRPRTSIKVQILAYFIVERSDEESPDEPIAEPEELPEPWTLFTDGSSYIDGSGAGLILKNPEGVEFTYAMRFRFEATNNEAEYEALIAGLRIVEQMGVKNHQANVDSHLVANQVNGSYVAKESGMVQYLEKVKMLASNLKEFSIKQVPRSENKKVDALSKITSISFGIDIAGPFPERPGKVKFLIVAIDYFTKWIEAKPVATITGNQVKKFVCNNIVCRFGLPGEIVSNNEKQFRDNPFKAWCEKLCICQCFASVKHPQVNGLVERANRSLGEGIKARLDERNKDWIGELLHVLWAHLTMIKSSNGETPFSLTYGTEAVILAKIGMPTLRTAKVDLTKNDEALEINLGLIEEKREQATIQEAKSKAKIEKYYNSKVRSTSFRPGDMVYHSNDASHAKDGGKLGPKWEGPYEITESFGKGAYKLKDRNGNELSRTWNICNLKKCYMHEV
ncbi:reverse transcriptase domain-containing protein [Tanacetum coccineum]